MSDHSKIEWTDATWNPVRGCSKVSPGCKNCYACAFAERFQGVPNHPYERGFELRLVPHKMCEPMQWTQSKRVFVNSMSDLFHPDVPTDYIVDVAHVMAKADWHIYQVLTKRSERMRDLLNNELKFVSQLSHIWWGVSAEDKKFGLPRIDHLRASGAAVKFISAEPLLEDLGQFDLTGIDWLIAGGESGRGARDIEEEWVQSLRRQCEKFSVAFFFKQWGGVQKSKKGRTLNDRTYDEMPTMLHAPFPIRGLRRELTAQFEEVVARWTTEAK